jgi:hypothetical protein
MNYSERIRSGMMMGILTLGVCGYAFGEANSTNVVVSPPAVTASTSTVAKPHSTNAVPVHHTPQLVAVESRPLVAEEGSSWLARVPVGAEAGDEWWMNRFEIGTRVTSFELTDATRPMNNRFLGSINVLKEDQDHAPTKLYANAWVLKWLGVGLSYEKMGVITWTEKPDDDPYTDGTLEVDGPILSLLAAWPNSTRFTPFAEVGQWMMSGTFKADSEWANAHGIDGFQDFEVTKEQGGQVWGGGCAIQITRNVEMDVVYRQIKGSLLVDHILLGDVVRSDRKFPLDSTWMGAGVKYRF